MGRFAAAITELEKAALAGEKLRPDGYTELESSQIRALRTAAQHLARLDGERGEIDMPVFVLLAKDRLSRYPVREYYDTLMSRGLLKQAREVLAALIEWEEWQEANGDKLTTPDHVHVPVEKAGPTKPALPSKAGLAAPLKINPDNTCKSGATDTGVLRGCDCTACKRSLEGQVELSTASTGPIVVRYYDGDPVAIPAPDREEQAYQEKLAGDRWAYWARETPAVPNSLNSPNHAGESPA